MILKTKGTIAFIVLLLSLGLCSIAYGAARVVITPGPLDHFVVTAPMTITAGESFIIRIQAQDRFNNVVTDYSTAGKGLKLATDGRGHVSPSQIPASRFISGLAAASIAYDKAEPITLTVTEIGGTQSGRSRQILVKPGLINHFVVTAPPRGVAGKPFVLSIRAEDAYRNVITNYASTGNGVNITIPGSGRVIPSKVLASDFINGVAIANCTYNKAGPVEFTVTEQGGTATGSSGQMMIRPGSLAHFVVNIVGTSAVAGSNFEAIIEAQDAYHNIIRDYDRIGKGARISTDGSGQIEPATIDAASFVDGVARVDFTYDKAEPITIFATEKAQEIKVARLPVAALPVAIPIPSGRREEIAVPEMKVLKEEIVVEGRRVLVDRIDRKNGWAYLGDQVRYINVRIGMDTQDVWKEVPKGRTPATWQAVQKLKRERKTK